MASGSGAWGPGELPREEGPGGLPGVAFSWPRSLWGVGPEEGEQGQCGRGERRSLWGVGGLTLLQPRDCPRPAGTGAPQSRTVTGPCSWAAWSHCVGPSLNIAGDAGRVMCSPPTVRNVRKQDVLEIPLSRPHRCRDFLLKWSTCGHSDEGGVVGNEYGRVRRQEKK